MTFEASVGNIKIHMDTWVIKVAGIQLGIGCISDKMIQVYITIASTKSTASNIRAKRPSFDVILEHCCICISTPLFSWSRSENVPVREHESDARAGKAKGRLVTPIVLLL